MLIFGLRIPPALRSFIRHVHSSICTCILPSEAGQASLLSSPSHSRVFSLPHLTSNSSSCTHFFSHNSSPTTCIPSIVFSLPPYEASDLVRLHSTLHRLRPEIKRPWPRLNHILHQRIPKSPTRCTRTFHSPRRRSAMLLAKIITMIGRTTMG